MSQFSISWQRIPSLLSTIRITDILDILVVAYLIYKLIMLIRRTNSFPLARGVLLILVALGLSGVMHLTMVNRLLRRTVELGLIALVILFQPELRRLLERVGSNIPGFFSLRRLDTMEAEGDITQIVMACEDMSASRTGALIVFERSNMLEEQILSGTVLNAEITAELLKNIFFVKAPLHDGAVIIRGGKIAAAGCVLPLTGDNNLSPDLGTRHRAGIGMSEQSDAVVIIVSEETGSISIAVDGMLKRRLSRETFEAILRSELLPKEKGTDQRFDFLKKWLPKRGEKQDEQQRKDS